MKVRHYVIIGIFILVNVLIIRTLNFGGKDKKPEETKKVFVPILKAKQVENSEEKFSVTGYGTISSFHRVDIACEVQGKMIKGAKELKPGVKFRKGELIFKVSDTEAQYNLRAKISGFMNIIAQLLPDIKVDFPTEFDKWNDYIESIKFNAALPNLPSWKTNKEKVFLSTRNVLTEYFSIKSMEQQLTKYYVYAPFNGVVTDVFISDYSVINPGTKVLTLAQVDNFEIAVSVPANSLESIAVGTKGEIFSTGGELKGIGTVVRISEVINKSTQSVDVYLRPKELEGHKFIEGEYVKVAINETGDYRGLRIPRSAVDEGEVFIYSQKDSTLTRKKVTVLDENEGGVFITGLADKEIVITQEVLNYSDTLKYGVLIK